MSLTPPLTRRVVEIESDRQQFLPHGVNTGVVEFAIMQAASRKLERKATLRAADAAPTSKVALYVDKDTPIAYRVPRDSRVRQHRFAGYVERYQIPLESSGSA